MRGLNEIKGIRGAFNDASARIWRNPYRFKMVKAGFLDSSSRRGNVQRDVRYGVIKSGMEVNVWFARNARLLGVLKNLSSKIRTQVSSGLSPLAWCATSISRLKNISLKKAAGNELPPRLASGVGRSIRKTNDLLAVRVMPRKEIQLVLTRWDQNAVCTKGELRCTQAPWMKLYTLEPEKPIPAGTYDITLYQSPHFGKLVPLLHGVSGYEAIEIHTGNYRRDTKGCVLVGLKQNGNSIESSSLAFTLLMGVLDQATSIQISIT